MSSKVFFHDARSSAKKNRLDKVRSLFKHAGFGRLINSRDKVAVKIHWGEPGNVGFLAPPYIRAVVGLVKDAGGLPFVTDTNTLYSGMRRNAVENLRAAAINGFTAETIGAPLVVADGLLGRDFRRVDLPGSSVGEARIASAIIEADAMIVCSHVKGHMLFGYGGALKNLGMGCAVPAGKQVLHSDVHPCVDPKVCQGDAICVTRCPERCIEMVPRNASRPRGKKVALIDQERCIGCGECTSACPHQAIPINWRTSTEAIQRKTSEYAYAAVRDKPGRVGYLNFIIQVTPDCDCCDWNDTPFVPDVGFAASLDPVALDAASIDLVAKTPPSPLSKATGCIGDPWRAVYDVDYRRILAFAEETGLGTSDYELVRL
ncbi:MAG TPA: DUF362 domain-containing protein [Myxococcota bacterium]|nr:DUF362 domain-containing protein [Myxococcota bacterium]